MRSPLVRWIAVAFAVLVIASCSSEESRLTKEELITQGDAICKSMSDQASEIGTDLVEPTEENLPEWADALGQLQPIYEDMTSQLKDLNPPEADQDVWDQMMAGLEQQVTAVEDARNAAEDGDLAGMMSALVEGSTVSQKTSKLAVDYGFKECGAE